MLDLFIFTGLAAGAVAQVFVILMVFPRTGIGPVDRAIVISNEGFFSLLRHASVKSIAITIVGGLLYLLAALALPLAMTIGLENLGSLSLQDLPFLALYSLFILGGGLWGGRLLFVRPAEESFRTGFLTIYLGALLAALAFIPLQQNPLPKAEFSDGETREATLVSHQGDYWYVIKEGDRKVTALPDDEVGTVSISGY